MDLKSKSLWAGAAILLIFLFGWISITQAKQQIMLEPLPLKWKADAELTDVCFVDKEFGWAVGDQGVILRTTDGGKSWKELSQANPLKSNSVSLEDKIRNLQAGRRTQTSGMTHDALRNQSLRVRFESVHFVDRENGWVAGGYQVPYLNRSRAVILRTQDGGKSWKQISGLTIPKIRKIHFDNLQSGWAVGDAGFLHTSGVFRSSNGGKSWRSDSQENSNGWLAATSRSLDRCLIDAFGRLNRSSESQTSLSVLLNLDADKKDPQFQDILMLDDQNGIAIGNEGSIVRTANGGKSWQKLNFEQAYPWLKYVDLKTASLAGTKIWFAGDPGSRLVSLDLASGTIEQKSTPVQTKINRIQFVDDTHGFAVGSHNVILKTINGGQSWKQVRGESNGSAVMLVSESTSSIPFSLLARYVKEEDRICNSLVLRANQIDFEAARQAMTRLGVSQCDLLERELPANSLRTNTDAKTAEESVLQQLIRQICTHRPAVIISVADENRELSGHHRLVKQAIRIAANRNALPHMGQLGLAPHRVRRLLSNDTQGIISIRADRLLPLSGENVISSVALSRALMGQPITFKKSDPYQIEFLEGSSSLRNGDIFAQLSFSTKVPTRQGIRRSAANLTKIKRANARAKRLSELLTFQIHQANDIRVWQRQVDQETQAMEATVAATWLIQLFEGYHRQGKLELASQTAQRLATRWSDSSYSLAALVWLAKHYSSDEQGTCQFRSGVEEGRLTADGTLKATQPSNNRFATQPVSAIRNGMTTLQWQAEYPTASQSSPSPVTPASHEESIDEEPIKDSGISLAPSAQQPLLIRQRLRLASRFLAAVGQFDPDLAASPWYQWMESNLSRRTGTPPSSLKNRLTNLVNACHPKHDVTEQQLSQLQQIATLTKREVRWIDGKPAIDSAEANQEIVLDPSCLRIEDVPHLDGNLKESCWTKTGSQPGNVFATAYNDEYLFVGIRCQKIKGANYHWQPAPRPHDANLKRRDRVAFTIDVDRDGSSVFRLEVDHRGWVADACQFDRGWNPSWFVAQSENEQHWFIEAAIPLRELTSSQPDIHQPWAIKVQRLTGDNEQPLRSPLALQWFAPEDFQWLVFGKR